MIIPTKQYKQPYNLRAQFMDMLRAKLFSYSIDTIINMWKKWFTRILVLLYNVEKLYWSYYNFESCLLPMMHIFFINYLPESKLLLTNTGERSRSYLYGQINENINKVILTTSYHSCPVHGYTVDIISWLQHCCDHKHLKPMIYKDSFYYFTMLSNTSYRYILLKLSYFPFFSLMRSWSIYSTDNFLKEIDLKNWWILVRLKRVKNIN